MKNKIELVMMMLSALSISGVFAVKGMQQQEEDRLEGVHTQKVPSKVGIPKYKSRKKRFWTFNKQETQEQLLQETKNKIEKTKRVDLNASIIENVRKLSNGHMFTLWTELLTPEKAKALYSDVSDKAQRTIINEKCSKTTSFADIENYLSRGLEVSDLKLDVIKLHKIWEDAGKQENVFDMLKSGFVSNDNLINNACMSYISNSSDISNFYFEQPLFRQRFIAWILKNEIREPGTRLGMSSGIKNLINLAHQAGDLEVVKTAIEVMKKDNLENAELYEQFYLPKKSCESEQITNLQKELEEIKNQMQQQNVWMTQLLAQTMTLQNNVSQLPVQQHYSIALSTPWQQNALTNNNVQAKNNIQEEDLLGLNNWDK